MTNIVESFSKINSNIKRISHNRPINIIAVSKTFPIDHIKPLIDYGHVHFGENKVQEAKSKWSEIKKKNINDMSFDELVDSLNELKQEVFNINIQKLAGQFEDTSQISKKKKDIARVKTMMSKHKNEVSNA